MNNYLRILVLLCLFSWNCDTANKAKSTAVESTEKTTTKKTPTVVDNEVPPEAVIENKKQPTTGQVKTKPKKDTKSNGKATTSVNQKRLEREMLQELNLLRSNPRGYIPFVESYISRIKSGAIPPDPSIAVEVQYAQTLIATLRQLQPMGSLKAKDDLYAVARNHGQDLKRRNNLMRQNPHEGSDGSQPGDRIQKATGLAGGENFGTGHESPRDQIVSLLVDAGVPSLGHRKNILNPDWDYAAGYYIGNIGAFDGCWLQVFAMDKKMAGGSGRGSKAAKVDVSPQNLAKVKHEVESTIFLRREEKEMIHEINRIRANPKAYISEVEAYIARVRTGEVFTMVDQDEEIATAQELIDELRVMEPLSILRPSRELYDVTAQHGKFLQGQGKIDRVNPHKGSDGLGAFDRIKKRTSYSNGGENFVGGRMTVKESVMELLVDSGIGSKGNRGHRLALLDPIWEYVVCHYIGTIPTSMGIDQNDCWLQNFAKK